ncbi:MAG: tetratricopeptide repeat protein [Alloalcanivorax sp.]|uniref:tetratricopeptide repeat protein n=1 Tax=uncultured Alcanivorax sp. TaxID=191215 RepID=UPI0025F49695|nr:tetratricopeptide repeat protein [uncultured Alcanivorax sp.]
MINTKMHKAVYGLAEKLMDADRKGHKDNFESLYAELQTLCTDNEKTDKDHPEQWETLADFTEDFDVALGLYEKALGKARDMNAKDYLSSIAFSMARLQVELGQTDAAINNLADAKVSANKIEDKELKAEIDELLESLQDR